MLVILSPQRRHFKLPPGCRSPSQAKGDGGSESESSKVVKSPVLYLLGVLVVISILLIATMFYVRRRKKRRLKAVDFFSAEVRVVCWHPALTVGNDRARGGRVYLCVGGVGRDGEGC